MRQFKMDVPRVRDVCKRFWDTPTPYLGITIMVSLISVVRIASPSVGGRAHTF